MSFTNNADGPAAASSRPRNNNSSNSSSQQDGIAVVSMACKFAGASSPEEFWDLLEAGTSMAGSPPDDRFPTKEHSRSSDKSVFYGNYLEDVASFDHQFFKKSSREAASMDPQQRLLLEAAYQALESAGRFGLSRQQAREGTGNEEDRDGQNDMGVFIGTGSADYNDNVASHPPTAYSPLGTLRAFISGRISHYFGLSGPSITYDTACSSSAVAIDAACKALQQGDCKVALAGGVSVFTSPFLFQNLATASFLSPTGPVKSFDASGDGYCRGEGVGLVLLKPLSQAVADGDTILGTILSTAVRQSSNTVPITVPHSPSQAALYQKVLDTAGLSPEDVTYLEAHGTGTPVGDAQEFDSIERLFGARQRPRPLHFASVKGNIGHTEGASGVASLIKVLLMMRNGRIPKQANYVRPNPKVRLVPGQLAIPTETIAWEAPERVAIINNYGAAGSMAAMVVKEAPSSQSPDHGQRTSPTSTKYPILLSSNSDTSLASNCQQLRSALTTSSHFPASNEAHGHGLADVGFRLSHTQNRALPKFFTTTASSLEDLHQQLERAEADPSTSFQTNPGRAKPVILVLGGQTARCASVSKDVYDSSALFRSFLDECDETTQQLGYDSIYPGIFSAEPFDDIVAQQARQFAVQYASAQTWLACGLKVESILGHSFGQLVGLAVSGILSLADGLRLACGRGALMRDRWGSERGSMIALDADLQAVQQLVSKAKAEDASNQVELACYNGPKSHVLVGSAAEISSIATIAKELAIRHKVMDITHGFHSRFCDQVIPGLEQVASELVYHEPKIPLETCSEDQSWLEPTPSLIADHTRSPVYFKQAIDRIVARNGSCIWLEAGSNSSVVNIARRALTDMNDKSHIFMPMDLMQQNPMGSLAETTALLWQHGQHAQFWPFHHSQRQDYRLFHLPPYQFERRRHWLDFKLDSETFSGRKAEPSAALNAPEPEPVLLRFDGFGNGAQEQAIFTIDPRSTEWQTLVRGHSVLGEPLCPASLYVELVLQASKVTTDRLGIDSAFLPRVRDLSMAKPLGAGQDFLVLLTLTRSPTGFSFEFRSHNRQAQQPTNLPVHATGYVETVSSQDGRHVTADFERLGKLVSGQNLDVLASESGSESVQGSLIYKIFSRVVQYQDLYRGVKKVTSSSDGKTVGTVQLPASQPVAMGGFCSNPIANDNFLQVPGLQANCLGSCPDDEVLVCVEIGRLEFAPDYADCKLSDSPCTVFAMTTPIGEKQSSNDIFVRHEETGKLIFVAFGAIFGRVRTASLAKAISRANKSDSGDHASSAQAISQSQSFKRPSIQSQPPPPPQQRQQLQQIPQVETFPDTTNNTNNGGDMSSLERHLQNVLSGITDVPPYEFKGDVTLDELGIDSLMATEIVSEVNNAFNVSISSADMLGLSTFSGLRDYLAARSDISSSSASTSTRTTTTMMTPNTGSDLTEPEMGSHFDLSSARSTSVSAATTNQNKNLVQQLAALLADHLECPASTFERGTVLADCGLDSLLCMELMSDMEQMFGLSVDLSVLKSDSTFGDLVDLAVPGGSGGDQEGHRDISNQATRAAETARVSSAASSSGTNVTLSHVPDEFEQAKTQYDALADKYKFSGFFRSVYPDQAQLVLAYTVEAFADLGQDLGQLKCGDKITLPNVLPRFSQLRGALFEILQDAELANYDGQEYFRSEKPLSETEPSHKLLADIVKKHPQHAQEHELLSLCGSQMSKILVGEKDPLSILFGSKASRKLLEEVYSDSPMFMIMSQLLSSFLTKTLSKASQSASGGSPGVIRILEVGAGTGATTRVVLKHLIERGVPVEYTFTDYSSSLVAAGKRTIGPQFSGMSFRTLNVEEVPPPELQGKFDVVLSTNCVHATSNLSLSLGNIGRLLKPDGFLSLVELTTRFYWFDLVFGTLEGWWLFDDGRQYALAAPEHWDKVMRSSGFQHVSWTGGSTAESNVVRVITGFRQPVSDPSLYKSIPQHRKGAVSTFVYEHTDKKLPLKADIYLPSPTQLSSSQNWTAGTVTSPPSTLLGALYAN